MAVQTQGIAKPNGIAVSFPSLSYRATQSYSIVTHRVVPHIQRW